MPIRRPSLRSCGRAAVAALLLAALSGQACAGLITTVLNSTAPAGGSGSFDVTLTNSGATGVDIGDFQVELSLPGGSGVLFLNATRGTALPYIFAAAPGPGNLNSDPLNPFPNTGFIGGDTYFALPGFATIGGGVTLGLMHVTYKVNGATPAGSVPVSLIPFDNIGPGGTFVNDGANPVTLVNGTITITATQPVPEPSTILLMGIGGGLLFLRRHIGTATRRGSANM